MSDNPPKPVFTESTITLQAVTRVNLSLSAGVIAVVEASGCATEEKNRLCRPNPWPHTPFDFVRHVLTGIRTEFEWQSAPDVLAWVAASRLDLVGGLDRAPDKETVAALQRRFLAALGPALANFDELARRATPTERARMYEPAA